MRKSLLNFRSDSFLLNEDINFKSGKSLVLGKPCHIIEKLRIYRLINIVQALQALTISVARPHDAFGHEKWHSVCALKRERENRKRIIALTFG